MALHKRIVTIVRLRDYLKKVVWRLDDCEWHKRLKREQKGKSVLWTVDTIEDTTMAIRLQYSGQP